MKTAQLDYIINTIYRTNTLPIISECNTACIFCSHRQNPPNVEVYRMPKLRVGDFLEIAGYLSDREKIVIGESATRIVEGEPFLHEDFLEILAGIRKMYPRTPIQVTTNGLLLDDGNIGVMEELGGIELNISVNCINPDKRKLLLGLKGGEDIRQKLGKLSGKLKFSGSCVLVPGLVDWEDVRALVCFLERTGGEMVRVFLPGYTSATAGGQDYYSMQEQGRSFLRGIRKVCGIPVVVEPWRIEDLQCEVEGVIKGSVASLAGMQAGDVVELVNGVKTSTRLEAFEAAFRQSNPSVVFSRGGESGKIRLEKRANTSPGFVMLSDISPEIALMTAKAAARHNASDVLIMTSELAYSMLKELFGRSEPPFEYEIIAVKNVFFGGTIKCAGLLVLDDVLKEAQRYIKAGKKPGLILLPPVMFDYRRRDLLGKSIDELEKELGIPVDTI